MQSRLYSVENKNLLLMFHSYRHFRLHLIPHVELFSENFHAYSVGENDEKIEIAVDKDSFYKGYDEGITLSSFTPVCDSQSNLILAQMSNISLWHFFLQKQQCGLSKARFKQRLQIVNYKIIYSCITCTLFLTFLIYKNSLVSNCSINIGKFTFVN